MKYKQEIILEFLKTGFTPDQISTDNIHPVNWIHVGSPKRSQGWKIHVSCRSDCLFQLISIVSPILFNMKTAFKVASSPSVVNVLNAGEGGATQVGKILTIYPEDEKKAVLLGTELTRQLKFVSGPVIENELRLNPNAPVYARYGSFIKRVKQTKLGINLDYIENCNGEIVPDLRNIPLHQTLGVPCPFNGAELCVLPQPIGKRFIIIGTIASTLHSKIEMGVDVLAGQPCVLKVVRRHTAIDNTGHDAATRLQSEYKTLKKLSEVTNIPRVLAYWDNRDWGVLSMEHIPGKNLIQYMQQQITPISQAEIAQLMLQLIRIIEKIHAYGIVIGDLSPTNVMIDSSGTVKLIDFEFAAEVDTVQLSGYRTAGYASPSILNGNRPNFKDDYYALGAIIYFLVSGTDLSRIPGSHLLLSTPVSLPSPWKSLILMLINGDEQPNEVLKNTVTKLIKIKSNNGLTMNLYKKSTEQSGYSPSSSLLQQLGTSIISQAEWGRDVVGVWRSRNSYTFGEKFRDFSMGDAGIAFGLLRIGLATEQLNFIEIAINVAEQLWRNQNINSSLPGLFVGEAGVGWLYLVLYELVGDTVWLDRAINVSRNIAGREFESPDLMHGLAGRGLFHCWIYEYSGDNVDKVAATDAAWFLYRTRIKNNREPLWRIPAGFGGLQNQTYYGLAHGSAGIAYFLSELARFQKQEWVNDLMFEIGDSLNNVARWDVDTGLPDWMDGPDGNFRSGVWCHGATGIGIAFLGIYRVSRKEEYLKLAVQAVNSAFFKAHLIGPTQCHGLAGLLEVCLDLYEETNNAEILYKAREIGEHMQKAFLVQTAEGPMFCSDSPKTLTPEFMVGSAGSTAALARLLQPTRFGHFLRSPRLSFRKGPFG